MDIDDDNIEILEQNNVPIVRYLKKTMACLTKKEQVENITTKVMEQRKNYKNYNSTNETLNIIEIFNDEPKIVIQILICLIFILILLRIMWLRLKMN